MLFPSIFYFCYSSHSQTCQSCETTEGNFSFNCSNCSSKDLVYLTDDPIYQNYALPLVIWMAVIIPIIYVIGVYFSLKSHAHIFKYEKAGEAEGGEEAGMSKTQAVIVLMVATVLFSVMAHVMTDKIPVAIEKLGISPRFVGLVFFTLIPNLAEYMNAIRFALAGNIGLSMEIGNQTAILTAAIEMPGVVALSFVLHAIDPDRIVFTLIFPIVDVFCVFISVFIRNSILTEKSVNYFTGIAFLTVFLLIAVVYYYDKF